VTVLITLLALAFAAVAAWLLWRAVTRGEVVGTFGVVFTRADAPVHFWLTAGVNALALAVFGAAALLLAWRALVSAPLAQRESALYPAHARAQNVSGLAILHCTVTEAFGVKDCSVTSETPPGLGFGASALQVSALYVLPQKDRAQARPGQPINLPIRFKMPAARRAASAPIAR
jgi:hypothetical protein